MGRELAQAQAQAQRLEELRDSEADKAQLAAEDQQLSRQDYESRLQAATSQLAEVQLEAQQLGQLRGQVQAWVV